MARVGPGGDLTNETAAWSNQQYQNALNATGSVINASTTGTYNWFVGTSYKPPVGGGSTGGGGVAAVGPGGFAVGEALGDLIRGTSIVGLLWAVAHNSKEGGDASTSGDNSGTAAQPPNDDDDRHNVCVGPPGPKCKVVNGWPKQAGGNCKECARKIQERIGGDTRHIVPRDPNAPSLGPSKNDPFGDWGDHWAVVKDGRVYDGSTGPRGLPIDEFKSQWEYSTEIDFGF